MKKIIIIVFLSSFIANLYGQVYIDSTINSSSKKIQTGNTKLSIGSYGEAHYNAEINSIYHKNGNIDVHRVILYLGYKFNNKLQFFSEVEFEHVKEIYVEQAFINYNINSAINFKTGLILIPMGYINEFHEPTLFNGVERPAIDKYMIPSTWSEMGAGFHGLIKKASIKYQVYAVNGFESYNGSAQLSGNNGIRSARQKGAKASITTPSVVGKLTYFGINRLRLAFSGYYGQTETSLYHGLRRDNINGIKSADSSIVNISIVSFNMDYSIKKIKFRAEGVLTSVKNTEAYNQFTNTDVAKQIIGGYGEFSYALILKKKNNSKLTPFVRFEKYDTHFKVNQNLTRNKEYSKEISTIGISLQPTSQTIFKVDLQWLTNKQNPKPTNIFNLGFGYWF